ncbi:MAG: TrkH family potassium uptake protein [Anaerovoracaceae bacterium]|jgi:trk system potassium uptake protein TrkH
MFFNYRALVKIFGTILAIISLSMLPSLIVSIIYNERDVLFAFVLTMTPMLAIGCFLSLKVKPHSSHLTIRDSYIIVASCWITGSILGALPFLISGYIPNFAHAFFETAAGFSTTGATILPNIEFLPKSLLFWRSFTHWIGGMGILVFAIALLPSLGISGSRIIRAEVTGPTIGKLVPRLTDSTKILYFIYIGFTLLQVILLLLGDMSLYDAMIHSFGSIGTGGFSNYNSGIAHFDSLYIEMIIVVFMFIGSINFNLYYLALTGHWRDCFKDNELRIFITILIGSLAIIALNLWSSNIYASFAEALRYSTFQSVSILTTTGFATDNFDAWPSLSKLILFLLMFIGGNSFSTSGGIKIGRVLILYQLLKRSIQMKLHPRAIVSIKVDHKAVPNETVAGVTNFVFLYIFIFVAGTILLSLENFDLLTTASAVATCLGNVGIGLNLVGPMLNFSIFSQLSTIFLGFLMLVGRLELFTILLLFSKQFWNPDK